MKKVIFFSVIFSTLLFASCRRNKCENVNCSAAGTCYEGNCICNTGYTGASCDSSHLGLVTFWASGDCSNAAITVNCDSFTAQVTQFFASDTPTCGSVGCANFRLVAGTYYYTATGTDSVWHGTVTVTENGCTLQHLGCTTGNVTFYYDSAQSNATVTINNTQGSITTAYTSGTPTCGAPGCANFNLPVGVYNYTATNSAHSWAGSVTVTANSCKTVLLQ